ncbi:aldose 1-epimerase family protein [Microbacterium dextranolyticum]|uniref:Galactose mutarotase n=1 Tax=Microbacterium dextranolyticum TaxID=36806 RepID=A0A9W6HPI1_9MICO|nr:aldose 1-epimerase family protein [Microbacterium dextranolyticum]MBM7464043.1 aldose 1-epimerase [Microbacterium dextranolyticum]GLJ96627.1 galactose mutarotase [Microbacterium dextranolyticum]
MTDRPRSGTQYTIRSGAYRAEIASIGASLRSLTYDGRDLVVPFAADEVRPNFRGALLAPWPNRVVDGLYASGGATFQLALTEPDRGHALHGFAGWLDFVVLSHTDDEVTLAATIEPQASYPWRVRVETTYRVGEDGLTQTVRGVNVGADAAPFGTGPHPYLVAGPGPLDSWTLELPAETVLEVTPDRLSPIDVHEVASFDANRFDWRAPRTLGAVEIDHAYTGLVRDGEGLATVRVTDPSGTGVEMIWDDACPWVQVHTADRPGGVSDPSHRVGLAVEPMTCAPDAFNAERYSFDAGLIVLQPEASAEASWRIRAV